MTTNLLTQKNNFVVSLRDYLMSLYGTSHQYTFGDSDYKAEIIGGAYCLVRKDFSEPRDLSGFCIRKDLCTNAPYDKQKILADIHQFSQRPTLFGNDLESKLDEDGNSLIVCFGRGGEKQPYLISTHIDGGYAGEISITLSEFPIFDFPLFFGKICTKRESV